MDAKLDGDDATPQEKPDVTQYYTKLSPSFDFDFQSQGQGSLDSDSSQSRVLLCHTIGIPPPSFNSDVIERIKW